MSTLPPQTVRPALRPVRAEPTPPESPPPLNPGDRLSRAEFERRYEAHPEIKKAELVEGVVYVSSPIRIQQHSRPHLHLNGWLALYLSATPGVMGGDNGTVRLDRWNEVQPDVCLWLDPARGGKSRITSDDYLEGPPELVVEIAASSVAYDLHAKKRAYERNGVPEYVAAQVYEQRVDWFVLRESGYETLQPDEKGILRSEVFPGLWLAPAALWAGDLAAMLATLQDGLASPEHAAFVARLQVS